MSYEKKYKGALKRAIKYKNGEIERELEVGENIMEYIFPEIKESKNERIRKDIIKCLKYSGIKQDRPINPHVKTIMKDALDWLESLKERITK